MKLNMLTRDINISFSFSYSSANGEI